MSIATPKPTVHTFAVLQEAYDSANEQLFGGELPQCMILVHRKRGAMGYFWSKRFVNREGEQLDEIALNPEVMDLPSVETLDTLVHEMCHLWQAHFGSPSRSGYHNREFAAKMESVGLMCSATGAPGGKPTGQRMSDYPLPGGAFLQWATSFLTPGRELRWFAKTAVVRQVGTGGGADSETEGGAPEPSKNKNKVAYECPGHKVWGKSGLSLHCAECDAPMLER